jgi:hypothetical protein
MNCTDFLERYSDYRDGLIEDAELWERMSQHLLSCPRCMQYDARVARGVTLFKTLSDIRPSWAFRRRLASRLADTHLVLHEPVTPAPAGIMVALMLITAAALFLWETTNAPQRVAVEPAAAEAPLPVAVANPGPPFVSFAHLSVPAFGGEWRAPGSGEAQFGVPASLTR